MFEISVASAFGIESVTKNELKRLGILDANTLNGRTNFYGGWNEIMTATLRLRTADRIYLKVAEFKAMDFDTLFEGVKAIKWEDYINPYNYVAVVGKCVQSQLYAVSSCQSITKKAIVERLKKAYHTSTLTEDEGKIVVEVAIFKDIVTLSIDLSGTMHKRGYRDLSVEAPLKETLAAGIIMLSNWRVDEPFIDCFCGSGTLPIEACMIAQNIAPGLNLTPLFLDIKDCPIDLWETLKEKAKDEEKRDFKVRISGFDIDENCASIAVHHAKNLGLDRSIHIQTQDMRALSSRFQGGTVVCNPPYGERLLDERQVGELYKDFGNVFRSLDNWGGAILTNFRNFERMFGQPATKNRKLFNANLECYLYLYSKIK